MEKRWILLDADEVVVSSLSKALKVPPLLARILVHRGFNEASTARSFLFSSLSTDLPSPFLMADMDRAVERLVRALESKELICIWGDYDVDGTTGSSALVSFLREIGGSPMYYIPHRIDEGYGMNSQGLERLRDKGVKLVVSVDCGISNYQEVEVAHSLGMDVVIVDHHEPPPALPPAVAVLNPHRVDCPFPDKGLSGAGLAFYLIIGLRAKLREIGWFSGEGAPDIRRHLDVITLGTIADMVPLRGVNRALVRRGLQELGTSTRPGILALRQVAGIPAGAVGVGQVAFRLGPRINAAGRMDTALKVVEMLTTESEEDANRIAQELDGNNRQRQEMEARVQAEALEKIETNPNQRDRCSIVLGAEDWHPGVLGIVASRIVERFHRPTVVIGLSDGEGKGSARSIRGFHLVEGLRRCADLLEKFGGHEYAAGLSIKQEKLPLFTQRFEEVAQSCLTSEDLVPVLEVDAKVEFAEIGLPVARQLQLLQPFGIGNPEPILLTRGVEVSERKDFNGGARFRLRQGTRSMNAVVFGLDNDFPGHRGAKIDVVYRLGENEWNGTTTAQLRIVDARLSEIVQQ
ncbi:MAG: single-stranded-DNA-specific exonuclease RecJ [Deltaproteobacteria bacterium]|nr:single-stranded-DNA-specific exonuclease RecJ [Deltaproteobacteria bacterium]